MKSNGIPISAYLSRRYISSLALSSIRVADNGGDKYDIMRARIVGEGVGCGVVSRSCVFSVGGEAMRLERGEGGKEIGGLMRAQWLCPKPRAPNATTQSLSLSLFSPTPLQMADPTKHETEQVFKVLKSQKGNHVRTTVFF